jgi:hypothetical protein
MFMKKRYTSKARGIKLFPGHRAGKSALQQCPGNNLMPLAPSVLFYWWGNREAFRNEIPLATYWFIQQSLTIISAEKTLHIEGE